MRSRARQLERDSDFVRRYLKLLENNVIGANGIGMRAKARDLNGQLDQAANQKIEEAWLEWGKTSNCTVNGQQSFLDVQRLVLRSCARDGAVIIRKVRNWDNKFRFALQVIEIDHLDHDFNTKIGDNLVRMGVERDKWERPVAYWLLNGHEGDEFGMDRPTKRERIPADEIILVTVTERPHQVIGVPWMAQACSIYQCSRDTWRRGYAARIAAAKMGFFEDRNGRGYQGEGEDVFGDTIRRL